METTVCALSSVTVPRLAAQIAIRTSIRLAADFIPSTRGLLIFPRDWRAFLNAISPSGNLNIALNLIISSQF